MTYKRVLLAGLQEKLPATISLFKTFNLYLFDNDSDDFADPDPVPDAMDGNPQTDSIESRSNSDFISAMQRLRVGEGAAEKTVTPNPSSIVDRSGLIAQPLVGETVRKILPSFIMIKPNHFPASYISHSRCR